MDDRPLRILRCRRNGVAIGVEMSGILSVERDASASGKAILLIRSNGGQRSLRVDCAGSIVEARQSELAPVPAALQGEGAAILGVLQHGGEQLLCVEPRYFFDESPPAPARTALATPKARLPPPTAGSPPRLTLFRLLHRETDQRHILFAAGLRQILEFIPLGTLVPLRGAPAYILGLARWRGTMVPVVDLGLALGLVKCPMPPQTRLLLVQGTRRAEPLAIPAYPELQQLDSFVGSARVSVVEGLDGAKIRVAFVIEGVTVVIPDFDALV